MPAGANLCVRREVVPQRQAHREVQHDGDCHADDYAFHDKPHEPGAARAGDSTIPPESSSSRRGWYRTLPAREVWEAIHKQTIDLACKS